VEFLIEIR